MLYYLPLTNTNTMTSNWSRWLLHKPRARDGSGPLWSPHWAPWHLCTFEGNVLCSDNIHTAQEERAVLRAFEEQSPVTPAPFVASSFACSFLISQVGIFQSDMHVYSLTQTCSLCQNRSLIVLNIAVTIAAGITGKREWECGGVILKISVIPGWGGWGPGRALCTENWWKLDWRPSSQI